MKYAVRGALGPGCGPAMHGTAGGRQISLSQATPGRPPPRSEISRHVSPEAEPGDRGRGLGAAVPDAIDVTVGVYERMFALDKDLTHHEVLDLGRRVGEALARLRPASLDEICGIAQGSGHPDELLLAINARSELLAGGAVAGAPQPPRPPAECAVIGAARSAREGGVLAQNWDFHPEIVGARLLWIATPPHGRGWATLTEAGILAKSGLNADGFALTMSFMSTPRDGGLGGVPVHVLFRWLLEDCASVDEVEAIVRDVPLNVSICVTVAARRPAARGRIAAFELVPDGYDVLPADGSGHIAHTNHFLTPASSLAAATTAANLENSVSRLDQLRRALDRAGAQADREAIVAALSDDRDPRHPLFRRADGDAPWLERCMTLATVAYEVELGAMWLRSEPAPSAPLERVALPWQR